jgi:hypothetical protein
VAFSGLAFINTGGRESLSPPVGGIIFAQPGEKTIACMNNKKIKMEKKIFFMK